MRIPLGGVKRVGGTVQKPNVIHSLHPLQLVDIRGDVDASKIKSIVENATVSAVESLKRLKRRGAVAISTEYRFDRAAAKSSCLDDLPPEIEKWHLLEQASTYSILGEVRETWTFSRGKGGGIAAALRLDFDRLFWVGPMGPDHYIELLLRATSRRQETHGDIEVLELNPDESSLFSDTNTGEDSAINSVILSLNLPSNNLATASQQGQTILSELREPVDDLANSVATQVNELKNRLSGWGERPFDDLVSEIDQQKSADAKGHVLEELLARLIETIPGFRVKGRTRTETEEIDILVLNGSEHPLWKKEGPMILCECKNWTSKCGKDEFVLFRQKLANRRGRCTIGVLVSWNGFASTVSKEDLRGSREDLLVLPVSGKDVRGAVTDGNFEKMLEQIWEETTTT